MIPHSVLKVKVSKSSARQIPFYSLKSQSLPISQEQVKLTKSPSFKLITKSKAQENSSS